MTDSLKHIVINFDASQILLLNICLGFLMFGVALDLKISDFNYILKFPKSVFAGLVSQWILLPFLTLCLIWVIKPEYSLTLGMLLIAACPGGNVSNYAVHLSGANTALSVVLTMISTVLCAFSTPFIFAQMSKWIPMDEIDKVHFDISLIDMIGTITQLILIPLCIGFLMNKYFPAFSDNIKKIVKKISMLVFISFVVFAVLGNLNNLINYIEIVFFIVLVHNGLALTMGYIWSKFAMKLSNLDAMAISIETGIQNSGLALVLIFNYFDGAGGMALIAAWWSIWHLISSLILALYWKKETKLI